MTLNHLRDRAHAMAREKGWHDEPRSFGESIALIHSEVSEALEEYRAGYDPTHVYRSDGGKLEGIPIELADVLIRIFDLAGQHGIDLDAAVEQKMAFNATRPHRHGGKRL